MEAGEHKLAILVRAADVELLRIDGAVKPELKLTGLLRPPAGSGKPLTGTVRQAGAGSLVAEVKRPGTFAAGAELTWAKVAKAELSDGAGKELFRAQVALDLAHLLETEVRLSEAAELKQFAATLREQADKEGAEVRAALDERLKVRTAQLQAHVQNVRAAVVDVSAARAAYEEGVKQLGEELLADKTVKQVYEQL